MNKLEKISGLQIDLERGHLKYDESQFVVEPKTRLFSDAEKVYLNKTDREKVLYWMYRYFEKTGDEKIFIKNKLEYDITVFEPGVIGREFIKTVGHYHAKINGTDLTYPEAYEVIAGDIEFLLQSKPDEEGKFDCLLIRPKVGEKVIVPPGFGHISINTGKGVAISSNVQLRDLPASSDYNFFKDRKGGAFYRTTKGLEPNPSYEIKSLRIVKPKDLKKFGIDAKKPLYQTVIEKPERFDFLERPAKYDFSDLFEDIKL